MPFGHWAKQSSLGRDGGAAETHEPGHGTVPGNKSEGWPRHKGSTDGTALDEQRRQLVAAVVETEYGLTRAIASARLPGSFLRGVTLWRASRAWSASASLRAATRLTSRGRRMDLETEKKAAAEAAAALVGDGMLIGLGTGSTVAYLLPALARRARALRCVATSPLTEEAARRAGLVVEPFGGHDRFDLAIDGADQIAPDGWLVKGGGAAHTREKLVAASAERFVVIADSAKPVARLHGPIPLELLEFGLQSTLRRLGTVRRRDVPQSPDGGIIVDFTGAVDDPATLAERLARTPGVVEHGLFPPEMVTMALVARGTEVETLVFTPR